MGGWSYGDWVLGELEFKHKLMWGFRVLKEFVVFLRIYEFSLVGLLLVEG